METIVPKEILENESRRYARLEKLVILGGGAIPAVGITASLFNAMTGDGENVLYSGLATVAAIAAVEISRRIMKYAQSRRMRDFCDDPYSATETYYSRQLVLDEKISGPYGQSAVVIFEDDIEVLISARS